MLDEDDFQQEIRAHLKIVNATCAERFWGGASSALGRRIRVDDGAWRTIVGVAADVKYAQINEAPRPYFYLPFLQSYRSDMIRYVRGAGAVDRLGERARARVAALDPDLPVLHAASLRELGGRALFFYRLSAAMLFVFGIAGIAPAAMGTYGPVGYIAKQSSHEIGIRMALDATARSVALEFVARGLRLGALGAAVGVAAALSVGRLISSVLFGVSATDAASFAQALAIVLGGVAVATLLPAWRAARTSPLDVLRHQ
jgi:putative ABC transport system permease protein